MIGKVNPGIKNSNALKIDPTTKTNSSKKYSPKVQQEKKDNAKKSDKTIFSGVYNKLGRDINIIEKLIVKVKTNILNQAEIAEEMYQEKVGGLSEAEYHDLIDPEKVAGRILDFAKSLAGGDPSKLDMLEDAVGKGFKEAEKILGGLPEVSKRTFDLVKEGFQKIREEFNNH